ncbi:hypothetical protein HHI36_018661 [Cryptolaemus montrouzieri]|uniref:PH domain-containing protein n=1 Tax=Cryptolaemus montrouzieri TaxID=559131 RepID=A0ABD2P1E3_9CUCU
MRLSKQCEPEHKHVVELALATMTGIASDINLMKRKHEHAVRVQEIQSQLYGWNGPDLTALGELVAEGTFRVVGARGRRHVFLFDKVFLMTKSKQDGMLAYKFHIMCSNLMLVEQIRGESLSFQVLPFDNPKLQCTLRARSIQHKREWTQQIKRVILENYSAVIPNHARQLVMELGQDIDKMEESSEKWAPLKHSSNTPHYLERRSRVHRTLDQPNRRTASQDRSFSSLSNWRRKSEPGVIPQFNSKTLPRKTTKLKKQKPASTFYTDLSDSENCVVTESTESLRSQDKSMEFGGQELSPESPMNLEKIVSDIVNEEFKKLKRTRCNLTNSDPTPDLWFENVPTELPAKSDSLPRSFQLNDQCDGGGFHKNVLDKSSRENSARIEDEHGNDLHVDDSEHPDHKIYRKSAIRVSLLQKIRALMSEQQKKNNALWKSQNIRNTGERIANPDYVDPQKFFLKSSRNSLIQDKTNGQNLLLDEPERLDMTINENDVLTEIDNRLQKSISVDSDQRFSLLSSHSKKLEESSSSLNSFNSSQNDSYYESILDDRLVEEYVKDGSGTLVLKQDSFRSTHSKYEVKQDRNEDNSTDGMKKESSISISTSEKKVSEKRTVIRRPNKAPPPVPIKPVHLSNGLNITKKDKIENCKVDNESDNNQPEPVSNNSNKSWVKAMVGRFE